MINILLVGAGGFIGSVLRYLLGGAVQDQGRKSQAPVAPRLGTWQGMQAWPAAQPQSDTWSGSVLVLAPGAAVWRTRLKGESSSSRG